MAAEMLNKSFLYGVHVVQVLQYEINDDRERFYLWTTRKEEPYDRPLSSALEFMQREFRPVNNTTTEIQPVAGQQPLQLAPAQDTYVMLGTTGLAHQLKDILMDNIKRVQENKDYIPQADVVRENVDSMIDLAKTEIAYMAVMKRRNHSNPEEDF